MFPCGGVAADLERDAEEGSGALAGQACRSGEGSGKEADVVDLAREVLRACVVRESQLDALLPVEVRRRLAARGHELAIHEDLLTSLSTTEDVGHVMPLAIGVGFARGTNRFVVPCAGPDIAGCEKHVAVAAACSQFAVRDRHESSVGIRGAEPEARGVSGFRDIEQSADVVAIRTAEGERLTRSDGGGEGRAVGRTIERGIEARDGIHGSLIEAPVRLGGRTAWRRLPADRSLQGRPCGIIEGRIRPCRASVPCAANLPS